MKFHLPRSRPTFLTYRKTRDLDQEQLITDLNYTPFYVTQMFDDIDDIHWAWQKLYTNVINDHTLKKVKLKGRQVPFINRELRKAIRLIKQLLSKYKRSGDSTDHLNYDKQHRLKFNRQLKKNSNCFSLPKCN